MGWNDHQEKPIRARAEKRERRSRQTQKIELRGVNSDLLYDAIIAAIEVGGALRFGTTRDGGAWSIGVYGDGEAPYTEYVRPGEDFDQYLMNLAAHLRNGGQG